jgi:hypothetical protein
VKSKSARKRHEDQEHSFEKNETKKIANFKTSKSTEAPTGYIWCIACTVTVENTVSGVSNHSKSMCHKSKSGRTPQLPISRRQSKVQKQPEDDDHS